MSLELADIAAELSLIPVRVLHQGPGRLVAKLIDDDGTSYVVKADEVADAFVGEVQANGRLAQLGVPVSDIVKHRKASPAVLLLRWVDGVAISSSSPVAAQQGAGRLLRLIHEEPGPPPFSGQPSVSEWISEWTADVADWWASHGATSRRAERLLSWCDELRPILTERSGCLTLFDGRADHFLVRGQEVAAIIDLHDLGSGDSAMDVAVLGMTDSSLLAAVIEGYRPSDTERAAFKVLIPFYTLLRRLAGAEWHFSHGDAQQGRDLLHLSSSDIEGVNAGYSLE